MGDAGPTEPEDSRALYRLPPEEFTAARDALARRLRASGDRDKADEVRKLRRPNAPAWALNQVAQGHPGLIEEVLVTGNELREAMEVGDGRLLREAERSTRHATDAVVTEAERVLAEAGHNATDDVRSRLAATLRAAIVDPEVATQVQAGMLERDVELPGFGMDGPIVAAPKPAPTRPARPKRTEDADERRERQARQEQEELEEQQRREEIRRQEGARRAAKRGLAELESEAKRLARHADRLVAAADRAEEEARRARAEANSAVAAADALAAKLASARRELESLDPE